MPQDGDGTPDDQQQLTYDQARAILLKVLASPAPGESLSREERDRRADVEVETLVQIGAYMVDRWAAETKATRELTGAVRTKAAKQAMDACTGLHFTTTTNRAHDKLRAFQDRHREMMPASIVRQELSYLPEAVAAKVESKTPNYEKAIKRWEWWVIEALKGFVAIVGVIVIGGLLSTIAFAVSPRLREEAAGAVVSIVSGGTERAVPSS